MIWVESLHDLKGVLNWYIADYDNDGEEELLVLTLDNAKEFSQDYDDSIVRNEVDLQMYEMEDGELKLQATYEGLIPVLGYGDKEDDGIFLKKSDDTIYICGSCVNDVYMYANGTLIKSFVLTYTDGTFQVQAGQENPPHRFLPAAEVLLHRHCQYHRYNNNCILHMWHSPHPAVRHTTYSNPAHCSVTADYQYYIYTIENGAAVYLDTIQGGHTKIGRAHV